MTQPTKQCDAFVLDTYRSSEDRSFHPGAITLKKRKTIEVLQWEQTFESQDEANDFVRAQLDGHDIREVGSV